MPNKISNTEWGLVIGAAIVVDLVQLVLDLFLIGVIANRFIDIAIGLALPFYFRMRGVKMDWKKGGSILFTFLLEFAGLGIDALPFWTGDVVLIMFLDKTEKKLVDIVKPQDKPKLTLTRGGERQFNPNTEERSEDDDIARAA